MEHSPKMDIERVDGYIIEENGRVITHLKCLRTSYNSNDVKNLWCSFCGCYVGDLRRIC